MFGTRAGAAAREAEDVKSKPLRAQPAPDLPQDDLEFLRAEHGPRRRRAARRRGPGAPASPASTSSKPSMAAASPSSPRGWSPSPPWPARRAAAPTGARTTSRRCRLASGPSSPSTRSAPARPGKPPNDRPAARRAGRALGARGAGRGSRPRRRCDLGRAHPCRRAPCPPSSPPAPTGAWPASPARAWPSPPSIPPPASRRWSPTATTSPRARCSLASRANARALLSAERVALNFLGRLCGVATLTRAYVRATAGTAARIVCTRKTTPGLRVLEKYAVRCGGGVNHRFGLDDAILIKDNHIAALRRHPSPVAEAVARAKAAAGHLMKVEVEVDTLAQLDEALAAGPDVILLDNFDLRRPQRSRPPHRRRRRPRSLRRRDPPNRPRHRPDRRRRHLRRRPNPLRPRPRHRPGRDLAPRSSPVGGGGPCEAWWRGPAACAAGLQARPRSILKPARPATAPLHHPSGGPPPPTVEDLDSACAAAHQRSSHPHAQRPHASALRRPWVADERDRGQRLDPRLGGCRARDSATEGHPLRLRPLGDPGPRGHRRCAAEDHPRLRRLPEGPLRHAIPRPRLARARDAHPRHHRHRHPPALDWGLDHGTWSVLCRMYPEADVPVVQLSLDRRLSARGHYEIGIAPSAAPR